MKNTKVSAAQCEEEIGICNENCSSRCRTSKNGKGICEKSSSNGVETCKCLYECNDNDNVNNNGNNNKNPSPKTKQCNVGIGPCSMQCNDVCCNQNCAAEYPGLQEGHGACLDFVAKVSGAKCEEEMGICDENCNSRCENSKKGKGICEKSSSNEVGTCKCLYECDRDGDIDDNGNGNDNGNSSLRKNQCNFAIGPCSWQCNDVCCDQNCAAEYPGPQEGHGACMGVIGIPSSNLCVCYYNC
ncbi:hypothetical protein V6N11_056815 [Hibiscus sabdariffa]|uniref:Defensin-like protein n=1 Tax=Hibiscus sabdariffa TaxID=183260 RepID=A0ABR2T5F8_9ROSI